MGDVILSSRDLLPWSCSHVLCEHAFCCRQSHLSGDYVWLACHDLSPVFRLSLLRFKLSQEVRLIPSLPLFSVFLTIFHCIFQLLASPSQHGHLVPFSPTLTLLLTIPRFANCLLVLFMSYSLASSFISCFLSNGYNSYTLPFFVTKRGDHWPYLRPYLTHLNKGSIGIEIIEKS